MSKWLSIGLLALTLALSTSADAVDGIYITLEGGHSSLPGLPSTTAVNASSIQIKSLSALRGGIGYIHDFSHWFGLGFEAGIGKYGRITYYFSAGDIKATTTTTEFMVPFIFHLVPKCDFLLRIGGIRQTLDLQNSTTTRSNTRIHPELIASLTYNFSAHFAAIGSYLRMFGQQLTNLTGAAWATPGANAIMFGLRATF